MSSSIPKKGGICVCDLSPVEGAQCIGNALSSDTFGLLKRWASKPRCDQPAASHPQGAGPGGDDRCDMLFLRSSMSLFRGCRL